MNHQIRISAKNLGAVAMADFCPRCFWIKLHCKDLPFQIFPGIFSTIDSYSKNIIHAYFDKHNSMPEWLNGLGKIKGYIDPPHHSKFQLYDDKSGILLTGMPDGVFVKADGSYMIVDYKTAKYTGTQDELFPIYEIQLNCYALIGEEYGFSPVKELVLIYMEPVTDVTAVTDDVNHRQLGMVMPFATSIHKVKLNTAAIAPLLAKVRKLYDMPLAPSGRNGCKDCKKLKGLMGLFVR